MTVPLGGLLGACLGVALGTAFAPGPVAAADAIDDAWPYLDAASQYFPYYTATVLPSPALLPGTDSGYTFDQTYSYSDVPYLYDSAQYVVTSTVDDLAYPHVGTVLDSLLLLPIVPAVGGMVGAPMFTNVSLDDPVLGFADAFTVLNGLTNTYLSDSAGVKDVLSIYGLPPVTLFEFPAVDAGGTAPESGDGFAQLLTELAGVTPSL
ncbi:hypothetical protein [[Mycobacterium] nativiensis]|uniref:PE-PPE domain-containing protein n=1 Tax=[Mycobacterium] nativiensis TaxID=2855503 RepID=A0ABU5Y457_9MYCO|nr:hypothetical protein [Mycolicibacter sp. MYC340]MEB3034867.1 hypothetical protein [Mycolicibacter sp. MYC340]